MISHKQIPDNKNISLTTVRPLAMVDKMCYDYLVMKRHTDIRYCSGIRKKGE